MKRLFADTFYWMALANPADQWHGAVRKFVQQVDRYEIVTTDEVLGEFLTGMAGLGAWWRQQAVEIVEDVLADESVLVIPQSHNSFVSGLRLYAQRLDKGYSLTDCVSMNTCREQSLHEVLSGDHHFEQEGLTLAISR